MYTPDSMLTYNLRPRPPRVWYGIAALTFITGFCSIVPRAVSFAADGRLNALRPLPSDASLRRSLLVSARPKVTELRRKMAKRGAIGESHGMFFRAPECAIKEIAETKILRFGHSITGVVRVACVWKSTSEQTFKYVEEAEQAELTEQEPGKLRLTFVYRAETGTWTYQKMNKE